MAKSKYEYVRDYETFERCLPNCWIVMRVDGRGFSKFAAKHGFRKPNDSRALGLMNAAAKSLMKEFPDILLAYGQSDEYSFVLKKKTTLFNRRVLKLVSVLCSAFTSFYITNWQKYFEDQPLLSPPMFDGRIVVYPNNNDLRDYLSWRQADTHVNNLYNTCFWNLVNRKNVSPQEAEDLLRGTDSSDKNELLFSEFGINYNNEPAEYRKGTTIVQNKKKLEVLYIDIIGNNFWEARKFLLGDSLEGVKPNQNCDNVESQKEKPET